MGGVIVNIAWALLAVILRLTVTHAQSVSEDECATGVHAIIARGQGGGDDLNVMSTLSDLILKQIPGSTTLGLPYDHDNVLTDNAKQHTVHDGAVLMQQFVLEYSESCPQTKIVVVGYSMGAVLMMDSLCGTSEIGFLFVAPLARFYNSTIIAAIAYGDETYIPGMPWNVEDGNAAHHAYVGKYNQVVVDFIKHRLVTMGR
ncbi:Cutinase [Penicillium italicum]|uniref:Cutinase n=1 Tax=Penicillium italicum TaxID=40296 RepID=A0A0A2LE95_PENIT|nr:Cutinase [Penicillium italicum]